MLVHHVSCDPIGLVSIEAEPLGETVHLPEDIVAIIFHIRNVIDPIPRDSVDHGTI